MRRVVPALLVAWTVLIAGCGGAAPGDMTASPSVSDQATPTETGSETPSDRSNVSVTYAINVTEVPDEFRSVSVTFAVVFVADPDGLGPCYRDTYYGPHDPTPTPMAPPDAEDCFRYGTDGEGAGVTLDLTTIDDRRPIGPFSAPGSFDGGHALLVVDVAGTLENGTRTTSFRDTAFPALQVANGGPADRNRPYDVIAGSFGRQYNVTIEIGPAHEDFRDEFKYEVAVEHE